MNDPSHQIKEFRNYLKKKGKQQATMDSYACDVKEFIQYFQKNNTPMERIEIDDMDSFQEYLIHERKDSINSIRRKIISIRQFYRFIFGKKMLPSPFDHTIIPARDETLPSQLKLKNIQKLFQSIQKEPNTLKRTRDAAIVSLLCYEGLKAHELINLKWQDLMLMKKNHASLHIEGSRGRVLALSKRTTTLLLEYKKQFQTIKSKQLSIQDNCIIFISFKGKCNTVITPQLTRHGLKFLLYDNGENNGKNKINAEKLRHFAIRHHLSLGKSPEEVMYHLGLKRLGNITKHASSSYQ